MPKSLSIKKKAYSDARREKQKYFRENEIKIRHFLTEAAGPRPLEPLCLIHGLRAKELCISSDDPYLTNAGKWGLFCSRCGRYYFSEPAVNVYSLIQSSEEFKLLLATRLLLGGRRMRQFVEQVLAQEEGSPSLKFTSAPASSVETQLGTFFSRSSTTVHQQPKFQYSTPSSISSPLKVIVIWISPAILVDESQDITPEVRHRI
ncbi:hypothetical protein NP233_g332 [Leucocoprinus birnbaumii]|uniref:Uncharacterized protein n=1 Tax=Leucocoprinus birnbaumii TaxID=56174 RepID=A0AAD5W3X3_9AGAR|nr:hypothetical protein NP233_g332 [Leucocoprinus birnbaumii]